MPKGRFRSHPIPYSRPIDAAVAMAPRRGTPEAQPLRMYGVCGDSGTPHTPARGICLVTCDRSLCRLKMRALAQNERMPGLMVRHWCKWVEGHCRYRRVRDNWLRALGRAKAPHIDQRLNQTTQDSSTRLPEYAGTGACALTSVCQCHVVQFRP
jgi:ribosomal protein S14